MLEALCCVLEQDILNVILTIISFSVIVIISIFLYCSVGMGRPTSDDEGGFRTTGRESPTADMMTLEEFLAEGMDKSSPKAKVRL